MLSVQTVKSEGPGLSSMSPERSKKQEENDCEDGVSVDWKTAGR